MSKRKGFSYRVGNIYTVETSKASILPSDPSKPEIRLHQGDMLEYLGRYTQRRHYQSDPIETDHFRLWGTHDGEHRAGYGAEGEYWPNKWGHARGLAHLYDADEV